MRRIDGANLGKLSRGEAPDDAVAGDAAGNVANSVISATGLGGTK